MLKQCTLSCAISSCRISFWTLTGTMRHVNMIKWACLCITKQCWQISSWTCETVEQIGLVSEKLCQKCSKLELFEHVSPTDHKCTNYTFSSLCDYRNIVHITVISFVYTVIRWGVQKLTESYNKTNLKV